MLISRRFLLSGPGGVNAPVMKREHRNMVLLGAHLGDTVSSIIY